jgi:hypothetical protein
LANLVKISKFGLKKIEHSLWLDLAPPFPKVEKKLKKELIEVLDVQL